MPEMSPSMELADLRRALLAASERYPLVAKQFPLRDFTESFLALLDRIEGAGDDIAMVCAAWRIRGLLVKLHATERELADPARVMRDYALRVEGGSYRPWTGERA